MIMRTNFLQLPKRADPIIKWSFFGPMKILFHGLYSQGLNKNTSAVACSVSFFTDECLFGYSSQFCQEKSNPFLHSFRENYSINLLCIPIFFSVSPNYCFWVNFAIRKFLIISADFRWNLEIWYQNKRGTCVLITFQWNTVGPIHTAVSL